MGECADGLWVHLRVHVHRPKGKGICGCLKQSVVSTGKDICGLRQN